MTIQIEQQIAKLKKNYTEDELEKFVRLSDRWLRKMTMRHLKHGQMR